MDIDTHETDGAAQAKRDREAIGEARQAAIDAVGKLAHLEGRTVVAALARLIYDIEAAPKRKEPQAPPPHDEGLDGMRKPVLAFNKGKRRRSLYGAPLAAKWIKKVYGYDCNANHIKQVCFGWSWSMSRSWCDCKKLKTMVEKEFPYIFKEATAKA